MRFLHRVALFNIGLLGASIIAAMKQHLSELAVHVQVIDCHHS